MQPRKFRILSAITAGSLAVAVVAITASSGTSQTATHTALAAQTGSFPPVNLDDCPILHTGYPQGGCVAQLQTDLRIVQDPNLVVDGLFGSVHSQTYKAVTAFQTAHGLKPDGMVGAATKNALETAITGSPVPISTPPPPPPPAPGAPAANPTSTPPPPPPPPPAPGAPAANPTSTPPPPPPPAPGAPAANPTGTGPAPGSVTPNCGYASCSYYLSRSSTKAIYDQAFAAEHGPEAATAAVCGAFAIVATPLAGVACAAIAASQGIWIWQEIIDAATQHGAQGACLKLTVNPLPFPAGFYWSTNNGKY